MTARWVCARINLGEYVKDGADLVNLEDTSALTVDFRLPERYQSRIARRARRCRYSSMRCRANASTPRVQALDPLLDANGRSIAVRATMPAAAGDELRPGMFARVLTVFAVDEAALVVPEEAIVPQGGKQFVIRIETEGEGDAIKRLSRRTEVQLGVRRGAQVQVSSWPARRATPWWWRASSGCRKTAPRCGWSTWAVRLRRRLRGIRDRPSAAGCQHAAS